MATPRRVKDILADRASGNFIGRQTELAGLFQCLEPNGPLVIWVHGIAGIGKSTLLSEFRARAVARGIPVLALDCRFIEPTVEEFQRASGGAYRILLLDSYESFLLLDSWIRRTFLPEMDETVRIVVASRFPPGQAWVLALEWQGLFRAIELRELSGTEARFELLTRAGVDGAGAARLNRLARGHPLTLRLAIPLHSRGHLEERTTQAILRQLALLYLEAAADSATRTALEAASVVLYVSRTLIQAMLPDDWADAYDRLAGSCFVEAAPRGLFLHDAVREAVATNLRSSDPHRFQTYREAAWRQLRREAVTANREQMWGYTSGMIFLLRNPVVREAFFPSLSPPVNVEPAATADGAAILEIAGTHETPAAAHILKRWWSEAPWGFRVARDAVGAASGFYLLLELRDSRLPRMEADPMSRMWRRHLRADPIPAGQTAVYMRRWLSAADGELPSPVQAACWLDVKRSYLELRPSLRRCYLSLCDLAVYGPTAKSLGFQIVDGASVAIDGITHHLAVLDFGPGSVDAWLTRLAASELEIAPREILDEDTREVILDGRRVALTALEFELLKYLRQSSGKTVARAELIEQVWGRRADCSSNVVDVLVRALRTKMGPHAADLVTVRGIGYSLRIED